ncbi:hypothetical protein ACFL7M_17930 [Thermodesulfobacteriota bacterium]
MTISAVAISTEIYRLSSTSFMELINGWFPDVINECYFEQVTRLFIKEGKIEIM